MTFELQHTDPKSNARAGLIITDHGQIETPIFMPVGTLGTVKGVHLHEIKDDIKAQIILGNTYHLYLRPGLNIIEQAGGLHKFNGFDRPMLTDSGGFQVFSLSGIRKMREEGVEFRSHIDGSKHLFTPEGVMDIERTIGADIMMAFDECTPGTADYQYAKKSMELTHRWLDRCLKRFNETEPKYGYQQALFPIVQGCIYPDLRKRSAEYIASKGAEGNAIGGLAVGEPTDKMYEMIEVVNEILPKDKPRYLMGVGTPINILEGIERGVDALSELGTGEVLVSLLDEEGIPGIVERAYVMPPRSFLGVAEESKRQEIIKASPLDSKYAKTVDRESAYEVLQKRAEQAAKEAAEEAGEEYVPEDETIQEEIRRNSRSTSTKAKKTTTRRTTTKKEPPSMFEKVAEKAATSFGRSIANALARGILGSLLKK